MKRDSIKKGFHSGITELAQGSKTDVDRFFNQRTLELVAKAILSY